MPVETGLADVVTLQRRQQARMSAADEESFFVDTLSEYQWARDTAGLAPSTLESLIKPVIEVCEHYGTVPWQLSPREVPRHQSPRTQGRAGNGALVAVTATVATTSGTSQAAPASAAVALPPPPPASGAYHIVTRPNGMYLYVKSDSHSNGAPAQAIRNDLSKWDTLSWDIDTVGSDTKAWQIRNTTTDKCMQAMGTKVDSDVLQQPCDIRSKAQLWRLTPDPATRKADSDQGIRNDFAGYLVSSLSAEEMALTLYQSGASGFTSMVLNHAVATDDRLFRFLKAGEH